MAGLSDNALEVLEARYLIRGKDGKVCETTDEMWERIAKAISTVEKKHKRKQCRDDFLSILKPPIKFLPNSPTLMNAGHPDGGVLAGCFVILIEDTMAQLLEPDKFGILDAVYTAAVVQKFGGGTGYSLSRLRPAGASVGVARRAACGPLGVLDMLNATAKLIRQGGRRAGANMGVLRVDHPDIIEFINCKRQEGILANFNLSVGLTDHFIDALANGVKYDLVDPKTRKRTGQLLAKDVFDNIVRNIHRNGEPGILFLDTINSGHPARNLGSIEATNPCAEQPLLPFESCVLGSLNLVNHMNSEGHLDFVELGKTIDIAVRFLDDTIDCSPYPIKEIENATKETRKIGLGVMGWADILISNNMLYGSKKAVSFASKLSLFLKNRATEASEKLAKEKGPFPAYEKTKRVIRTPRRNACLTTIAPTGSISKIADCSPGIEPTFGAVYSTTILDGQTLEFIHPEFQRMVNPDRKMLDAIREKEGSLKGVKDIPANLADLFAKGTEIETKWHVKMQAAFQESVDSGVSKTVNVPNDATQKDISEIILLAAEEGCKGITVYRHGSRDLQVITYKGETVVRPKPVFPAPRPDELQGATNRYGIGECGKLYITTNLHEKTGLPIEIFGQASSACPALIGIANKLMSLILRMGADAEWLAGKLDVLPCHACRDRHATVRSCPDAFRKDLLNAINKPAMSLLGTPLPQVAPMACYLCNKGIMERMPTLKGRDCRVCTFCGNTLC